MSAPRRFDLRLPALRLEAGARVDPLVVRGWCWGPPQDAPVLQTRGVSVEGPPDAVVRRGPDQVPPPSEGPGLDPGTPTRLVIHALTGTPVPGGADGWWRPVVGKDQPLDPTRARILSFALLGGCYGTTGPADPGFPTRAEDAAHPPWEPAGKGAFAVDEAREPATVTTWDQARAILLALDALGVHHLELVTGGSLGAMVATCLAVLAPDRVQRLCLFGGSAAASPWIVGWNHVAAQILRLGRDAGDPTGGLHLARQLAMLTYRAEPGLTDRHARDTATGAWTSRAPYRVTTWLTHHGDRLVERFDANAYLALLGAMSHHDLDRDPPEPEPHESWAPPPAGRGVDRIRASTVAVGIDTDQLYLPLHMQELAMALKARDIPARFRLLESRHGHDAFLMEWPQVRAALSAALSLPPAPEATP